jgi:hypothetical protein
MASSHVSVTTTHKQKQQNAEGGRTDLNTINGIIHLSYSVRQLFLSEVNKRRNVCASEDRNKDRVQASERPQESGF